MPKSILLLEDDRELAQLLNRLIVKRFPDTNIHYVSGFEEGLKSIDKNTFDLFLLDFQLGENRTSVEFARVCRQSPQNAYSWIIFMTAYPENIYKAMNRFLFCEYVLKPVNVERMLDLIDKLLNCRVVEDTAPKYFNIRQKNTTLKVSTDDIFYVEMLNKNCILHMGNRTYEISRLPLKEVILQLPKKNFIQCHKSFILNKNRIDGISHNSNGCYAILPGRSDQIPIGDVFRETVLAFLDNTSIRA